MQAIHALSTGPLPSGVAVIRLSGEGVFDMVRNLTGTRRLPPPRTAMLRSILHPKTQQLLDKALIITFPGPNSFTGEDVAELHCHGSPAVVSALLRALTDLGSRPAEAGEFTRRAFLHGRMDLTQAEALSDLLAAETDAQRELALANSGGRLRAEAEHWRSQLIDILADMEADFDFADESDVAETPERPANRQLAQLVASLETALNAAPLAERIRHGLTIAIVGPPNAGKSSLMNALARRDVAIVTPHAGTTRDVLEIHVDLAGRPATLLDTAGLRETADPIEAEGIARARARASSADLLLDLGEGGNIRNKIDETGLPPGRHDGRFHLSARTGAGLAELESWLTQWAATQIPTGEPPLVSTERQRQLIAETLLYAREAQTQKDPVLAAESLRSAAHALGRLTGRIDPEAVLGAIFSRFCIGK
ncbi:tRNA uridine-5-carboxymethylaminomethyl(34) synthesis GTPase MnmE [Sandaracinobacter sp. RS1-74]|uniref:tRNA uridine-5-carboxymethylaminomethyl(34) synthesis GTPase MnmE n=1 Tax=Sandaracinobacteroides sayramensis TaxID=2913411 RepID=UPI001EDC1B3C|nr:tRNA uridine-5-carboxymethylaminomethyl(34) synthesis GTPase MnmE [Sandaracinobacteroides sayramensis]MCG2841857.1 tRNA uridine-5-carboxymethylaminomethyl(34) synthesis GTPase MnmE [Sandaracinobacteroides sayramensis]